ARGPRWRRGPPSSARWSRGSRSTRSPTPASTRPAWATSRDWPGRRSPRRPERAGSLRGVGVAWGLISTARINDLVLAGARASDRVDVVAVASRDRGRGGAYARDHGIERGHRSYEALLAGPGGEAAGHSAPN